MLALAIQGTRPWNGPPLPDITPGRDIGRYILLAPHRAENQPELHFKIEPEYTDEARRAKLQGSVMLRIEVNERGKAQNISIRQSLGLGLDERAVEAVKRWQFRPGTIGGKPVVTIALVEVNFRLL